MELLCVRLRVTVLGIFTPNLTCSKDPLRQALLPFLYAQGRTPRPEIFSDLPGSTQLIRRVEA